HLSNKDKLNKQAYQPKNLEFIRKDSWGRKVYHDLDNNKYYVDVDGVLHTMTDEGEPIHPIEMDVNLNKNADKEELEKEIIDIEKEHKNTVNKIRKDISKDDKLDMSNEDIYLSIGKDHIDELGEKYYDKEKGIKNFEKELEKKKAQLIKKSEQENIFELYTDDNNELSQLGIKATQEILSVIMKGDWDKVLEVAEKYGKVGADDTASRDRMWEIFKSIYPETAERLLKEGNKKYHLSNKDNNYKQAGSENEIIEYIKTNYPDKDLNDTQFLSLLCAVFTTNSYDELRTIFEKVIGKKNAVVVLDRETERNEFVDLNKKADSMGYDELEIPSEIDFRYVEGIKKFNKDTEEYKVMDGLTEDEWTKYLDVMAGYGVWVSHDEQTDEYVVENQTGQEIDWGIDKQADNRTKYTIKSMTFKNMKTPYDEQTEITIGGDRGDVYIRSAGMDDKDGNTVYAEDIILSTSSKLDLNEDEVRDLVLDIVMRSYESIQEDTFAGTYSFGRRLSNIKLADGGTVQPLYTTKCPRCESEILLTPSDKALSNNIYCKKCKRAFEPKEYKSRSEVNLVFPDMKFLSDKDKSKEKKKSEK
ncbi:MAG: hypothetical protein PHS93_08315, partial [Candidatus Omnitrophica bacterium]|nr:hypothetical protein [Candidatus Omnitrophota bacterium]